MQSMSTTLLSSSRPVAVVAAVLFSSLQLAGVTTLARHDSAVRANAASPRLVQLERVVVTGKRAIAAAQPTAATVAQRTACAGTSSHC